jgi:hypothetical protein
VYINGTKILDYDINTRQPGKQRQFLDAMDLDMDEGIELNGEMIDSPNQMQRANYVAMSLKQRRNDLCHLWLSCKSISRAKTNTLN